MLPSRAQWYAWPCCEAGEVVSTASDGTVSGRTRLAPRCWSCRVVSDPRLRVSIAVPYRTIAPVSSRSSSKQSMASPSALNLQIQSAVYKQLNGLCALHKDDGV